MELLSREVLEDLYPIMGIARISEATGEHYDSIRYALDYYNIPILAARPISQDPHYNSPYPPEFNEKLRERIRERDGRKCVGCNKTENELRKKCDVHHVDGNKYNNAEENLISYCARCHHNITDHRRKYIPPKRQ